LIEEGKVKRNLSKAALGIDNRTDKEKREAEERALRERGGGIEERTRS
jgi:hypothetical protein